MNIALLIDELRGGGSERVVHRLAIGLVQRGHGVFVYCLRQAGIRLGPLAGAGVIVREAHSAALDPLLPWRLGRWLRRDRIAVAHAHSCAALVSVFPAARLLAIPIVHVWHGWPSGSPTKYHRLAIRLDRFVTRVGANSQWLCDRLADKCRARPVAYLPNGIDLEPLPAEQARTHLRQLCGSAPHRPIVLNVGNIRAEKDTLGLLRAFALLRRDLPTATLVCVGEVRDETYWSDVCRLRRELGLTGAAHFPGPVEDAWRLMAGADVLCLSSQTESLPNVVLEGLTQRVPIVATAVGDVGRLDPADDSGPWILRHDVSGLLAPPGEPAALAAALARSLQDPAAARQRASHAFQHYRRHFTTALMVRGYERLYEECRPRRRPIAERRPRRAAVLMLGPAPPLIGGMVTSISLLMNSPLRRRYELHRCATTRPIAGRRGPLQRAISVLTSPVRHLVALGELTFAILARRIDLVHIHTCSHFTFYRNLLDLAAAKLLGAAVVLHVRGGRFERFCAAAGPRGKWLIRRGLETADAVIVLSERWRVALRPHVGRARLFVAPNAVEVALPGDHNSTSPRPCRFLYMAALTRAKGLADLIEAAALMRRDGLPFELVIAGPAPDEPQSTWERRVREAGLGDVTTFVGAVAGVEKARLLATTDCFVHPSHSEGLPNAILEAAAAGLPIVATAVGSVPELVGGEAGDTPLSPLVEPLDTAALAREMTQLACDAPRRRRIGQVLRRHVEAHCSLSRVSARVAEAYEAARTPAYLEACER